MNAAPPHQHDLSPRFVGKGSEYFGIWIVNLMLIIFTLSFYYPWARARSLRWFASNTEAGDYPFEFTGIARQMFGGFMIALAAFILYSIAGDIDPRLGWLAFLVGLLVWPWLMRAALRFRLARTRWRGLTMHFTGTLGDVYVALRWPIIGVGLIAVIGMLPESARSWYAFEVARPKMAIGMIDLIQIAIVLVVAVMIPGIHYRISRYQHDHFAWGSTETRFSARPRQFYGLHLRTGALTIALIALPVLVFAALTSYTRLAYRDSPWSELPDASGLDGFMFAGAAALILYVPLAIQLISAYFSRGSFNLRWSHTDAESLEINAHLGVWRWFGLRAKNFALTLLTLGLYKPFAQVAIARMKFSALTVTSLVDPAVFTARASKARVSAASDAAADLFDLDVGL